MGPPARGYPMNLGPMEALVVAAAFFWVLAGAPAAALIGSLVREGGRRG